MDSHDETATERCLIEEYKVVAQYVAQIDHKVWTSASLIIGAGFVAVGLLAGLERSAETRREELVATTVAAMLVVVAGLYWFLLKRWERLDRRQWVRGQEIEQKLGLWRMRYSLGWHDRQRWAALDATGRNRIRCVEQEVDARMRQSKVKDPQKCPQDLAVDPGRSRGAYWALYMIVLLPPLAAVTIAIISWFT